MPSLNQARFLVPEVVQTSAMDCGPAALKSLLEGFGIPASYGRLREACQTDVDGTSIDTLEDVARQLGLQATQMMAPVDHLLLPSAQLLPALVVTVQPGGLHHFLVVWRMVGSFVQIMDPATGRRWPTQYNFLDEVYAHTTRLSAATWRAWAGNTGFLEPLCQRLTRLKIADATITPLIEEATLDPTWQALATLDATTRMVEAVARTNGLRRGDETSQAVVSLFQQARQPATDAYNLIPPSFWTVQPVHGGGHQRGHEPLNEAGITQAEDLLLRGAVLIQVTGRRPPIPVHVPTPIVEQAEQLADIPTPIESPREPAPEVLTPDLAAVLGEPALQPERTIWQAIRADGLLAPTLLILATTLAAATVTLEAALLRGVMALSGASTSASQSLALLAGLLIFMVALLPLEFANVATRLRIGRRLETRLRIALLEKIPTLGDCYFHSRLVSDMAQRAYSLQQLHSLPELALRFWRLAVQLLLTAAGLIFLNPAVTLPVLLAIGFAMLAALLSQPWLAEQDLRVRTHAGALSRFYLDALLGLTPIRTHSAERVVRREHEGLLVEWARSNMAFLRLETAIQSAVTLVSTGFAVWIVFLHLTSHGEANSVLLLLYWALTLPALGQSLVLLARQYPAQRNNVLRLLEPLGAPEEETAGQGDEETRRREDRRQEDRKTEDRKTEDKVTSTSSVTLSSLHSPTLPLSHSLTPPLPHSSTPAVAIRLDRVMVRAGGQVILPEVTFAIQPGEQVAIVGASGAGKSSLVGLLLGWHRPAAGELWIDGVPLTGATLAALRRVTAWVDPAVHLWNRSLLDNLYYGSGVTTAREMETVIEAADLYPILTTLPSGLETKLGEGGGLVSGGEGQRVRLGRSLFRPGVRLVILDEPFRGLARTQRRQLLINARRQWQDATLLCITHDVSETQDFGRVLVMESGRIVEDGAPQTLALQPASRYQALLHAEAAMHQELWQDPHWRRLWLEEGRLQEVAATIGNNQ